MGKMIIRLSKQFAVVERTKRIAGENGDVELKAFKGSDLCSDDLVFDTANELEETTASRKAMLLQLLDIGLLGDENGKLNARDKTKILDLLGFGNWEDSRDLDELHLKKASRENEELLTKRVKPDMVDNHDMHILEHSKLLLKADVDEALKERVTEHINLHREYINFDEGVENLIKQFNAEGE